VLIVYALPSDRSKPTPEVGSFQSGAVFKDKYFIEKKGWGKREKKKKKQQKQRPWQVTVFHIPESETHLLIRAGTSPASLTLQVQSTLFQKDKVSHHGLGYSRQR